MAAVAAAAAAAAAAAVVAVVVMGGGGGGGRNHVYSKSVGDGTSMQEGGNCMPSELRKL